MTSQEKSKKIIYLSLTFIVICASLMCMTYYIRDQGDLLMAFVLSISTQIEALIYFIGALYYINSKKYKVNEE